MFCGGWSEGGEGEVQCGGDGTAGQDERKGEGKGGVCVWGTGVRGTGTGVRSTVCCVRGTGVRGTVAVLHDPTPSHL